MSRHALASLTEGCCLSAALALAASSFAAAGCSAAAPSTAGNPADAVAPRGSAGAGDENAEPASRDADGGPEEQTQRLIQRRLALVSELRGLDSKHPVRGAELSGEEMVEHVRRNIDVDVPKQVIAATNAFLYLAGIVDAEFDYKASLLEVMGTDLAGFYDPDRKTMYLRKGLGRVERAATLAHELVHALQDQHYDLAALDKWEPDASDRRSALHGLAEGDATSAMLDGMVLGTGRTALDLPEQALAMQVGALASESSVADIVLRAVVAPYVDGLRFVHALRREGDWPRVDEAWKNPPVSTEQLLHPEKYLAGEAPEEVAVPSAPPGSSMSRIYQDVEGEQALRILFGEWFQPGDAEAHSADWAGDRLAVFAEAGRYAFAWVIRYDSEAAASAAMTGMAGWQSGGRGRPARGQNGSLGNPYCGEDPERGPLGMARRGRDIAVVGGPSKVTAGCSAAARWLAQLLAGQGS